MYMFNYFTLCLIAFFNIFFSFLLFNFGNFYCPAITDSFFDSFESSDMLEKGILHFGCYDFDFQHFHLIISYSFFIFLYKLPTLTYTLSTFFMSSCDLIIIVILNPYSYNICVISEPKYVNLFIFSECVFSCLFVAFVIIS